MQNVIKKAETLFPENKKKEISESKIRREVILEKLLLDLYLLSE